MKALIHPLYQEAKVTCSCGHTFTTKSTKEHLVTEVCSKCHPFYTKKEKILDTKGRVALFEKRYGKRG